VPDPGGHHRAGSLLLRSRRQHTRYGGFVYVRRESPAPPGYQCRRLGLLCLGHGRRRARDRAYQARRWREGKTWKQRHPDKQREADLRYRNTFNGYSKQLLAGREYRRRGGTFTSLMAYGGGLGKLFALANAEGRLDDWREFTREWSRTTHDRIDEQSEARHELRRAEMEERLARDAQMEEAELARARAESLNPSGPRGREGVSAR
jgi:hypothetical protein